MTSLHLARMSRPDFHFPVTYFATESSNPLEYDYVKLTRILRYLVGTIYCVLWFRSNVSSLHIFADASPMIFTVMASRILV